MDITAERSEGAFQVAFVSGASMVYSQVVTAVFGVFLGSRLGATDYGIVNLARTVFVIALVAAPLGLDLALQRDIRHNAASKWDDAGEVNALRLVSVSLAAAIAVLLLAGGASALENEAFRHAGFGRALAFTMLALPFGVDMAVLGGAYRGLSRPSAPLVATYVIQPTARVAIVLALFLVVDSVTAAVAGTAVSFGLAALWMASRSRVDFPFSSLGSRAAWRRARSVLAYSPVLGLSTLVFTLARSLDTLTLARFAPSADVGRYAIVLMVGQLVAIIGASLGQTLGARVATSARSGDLAHVEETLRGNMELASTLCAPFCVAIAIWGADVDLLLGKSYEIGMPVFVVASVTQWTMTTTHNASAALSLTGRHGMELLNNIVALAVQALACLVLVPRFGLLGAAASTTLSIFAINALRQFEIAALIGRSVFSARLLWPLVLAASAALPWRALQGAFDFRAYWLTALVVGGQLITSFVLILAVGISNSNRSELMKLMKRVPHIAVVRGGRAAVGPEPPHEKEHVLFEDLQ